jgi:phosphatidylinositol alpha-mannosyltransferase
MAAGLPVVAVDGSGTRDIVEHGKQGYLVDNDPVALAQGIEKMLADPQRIKRFGNRALKTARAYEIEALSRQLLGVYEQAIEDKKQDRYVTLEPLETAAQQAISAT